MVIIEVLQCKLPRAVPWGGMLWFCCKQDEDRAVAFAGAVQPCKFGRSRSFGISSSCTGCMSDRSELPCLMYLSITSAGSGLLGHECCPGIRGLEWKVRSLALRRAIKANIIGFHWINGMWSWAELNADQLEVSLCLLNCQWWWVLGHECALFMGFVIKTDLNTDLGEKHSVQETPAKHNNPCHCCDIKNCVVCVHGEKFLTFRQRVGIFFISGKTKSVSCSSLEVEGWINGFKWNIWHLMTLCWVGSGSPKILCLRWTLWVRDTLFWIV